MTTKSLRINRIRAASLINRDISISVASAFARRPTAQALKQSVDVYKRGE